MPLIPPTPEILIDHDRMRQIHLILNGMPYDVALEHLIFATMQIGGMTPTTDGKPLKIEREGHDMMPFHRNIHIKIQADRP